MKPSLSPEAFAPQEPPKPTLGWLLATVRAELVRAIEAEFADKNVDLSFTQYLILK